MKKRVLFLYRSLGTFVQNDLDLLSQRFEVVPFHYRSELSLPRLARAVRKVDLTFSWFASRYAAAAVALSRRFGKRSAVVAGGHDAANVPEIGYGMATRRFMGAFPRYCFANADLVLAVSDSTASEVLAMAEPRAMVRVYNGVRCEDFTPADEKDRGLALTVGLVNGSNAVKKGIRPFVEAARHLPDMRFLVVGEHVDDAAAELRRIAAPNVELAGRLPHRELVDAYRRAAVYVQASVHESFGISVAEAMLCGCVPVVTGNAALPEVVGPCGVTIPDGGPEAIADGIRAALEKDDGAACRRRVLETFPLERRRDELFAALDEHLGL